jgi:hypothetical protein
MLSVAGATEEIVKLRLTDLLSGGLLESVTEKMSAVGLAVAVGVPVIAPVDAFSFSPVASVPLVRAHV